MKLFQHIGGLLVFCLLAVGIVLTLLHTRHLASYSARTTGTVIGTSLVPVRRDHSRPQDRHTGNALRPVVKYRYEIDGQQWTSDTIFMEPFHLGGNLGRLYAKSVLEKFSKEQTVTVYFNPEMPSEACLIHQPVLFYYLFNLGLVAAGGLVLLVRGTQTNSSSPEKIRGLARSLSFVWYSVGAAAVAHYLMISHSLPSGGAWFWGILYCQLGLFPLSFCWDPDGVQRWGARLRTTATLSLIGTFLGFWLGLALGMLVAYFTSSASWGITLIGVTPPLLAVALGSLGILEIAEEVPPESTNGN